MIYVDTGRCTGCGVCVEHCPTGALRLVEGVGRIDQELCQMCETCIQACPEGAILAVIEPTLATEQVPVASNTASLTPQIRKTLTVRPASRALPWVGAALTFVGREIVPRIAVSLLNAWDRRASGSVQTRSSSTPARPEQVPATDTFSRGGRGRRVRRRQGRH